MPLVCNYISLILQLVLFPLNELTDNPSQTFSPRYATFSPFFASFVTLSPRCDLSPHIIDNYATLYAN